MKPILAWTAALACSSVGVPLLAKEEPSGPGQLAITRASAPIVVDGLLDDPGWQTALRVDDWYETNPGDNIPPKVKNVGYLAHDDKYLYAGFEFEDPDPASIRAPFADRDNTGSDTDYAGLILNPRNDGRTGLLLLANPRGIQYDAVNDDATGTEDSSPDYFWDAAAHIGEKGWTLEIRVPFSSLRYPQADPAIWRVMLYRNYPREFRYQMFSTTLPRGSNCFICRSTPLTGLSGLPKGGSLVAAPYVNARHTSDAVDGPGTPLSQRDLGGDLGGDLKWTPSASTAIDATLNPDFSQIESDVAQIGVNERFALLFPEKRPFFLEGVELLGTPIQAVYTRTLTAPRFGLRGTGKSGRVAWTALFAQDEGGGSVILPGPNGSEFADQDFRSWVAVSRVRRDLGKSFVSLLGTVRRVQGGGHNFVLGPDFQYRTESDNVTGQLLYSSSHTPNRPELASEWDGRKLHGHGGLLNWSHNTTHADVFGQYQDFGEGFRADDGFVPQVGFRELYGEGGYTFRPQGFLRRLRTFAIGTRSHDQGGRLLNQQISIGAGMDARFNSFGRFRVAWDRVRAGEVVLPRTQFHYQIDTNPTRSVTKFTLQGFVGEQIDFDGARTGHGARVMTGVTLRPTNHMDVALLGERRWLNVAAPGSSERERLFTAQIARVRATYTFTPRAFLRLVGQYVDTRRDVSLYGSDVYAHSSGFNASALFAYKLNWQTVLFLGYGEERALNDDSDRLEPQSRQFFLKISYAFQR